MNAHERNDDATVSHRPAERTTVGEATNPAATGSLPAGYEPLGELGRGGMGVVYKARHLRLNRLCAVKMILAGGHADARHRDRFEAEAQAVARLNHPGIVQVYEVGEHAGLPFMALEYCPGGSLDQRLRDRPPTPAEAAAMVRSLAVALQAAHAADVVHRDLKPANVLLTADGALKVTDFGLAKKLDEAGMTRTGAVMGTPSYMPPEQARGEADPGPAVDVYALGAVLYACLTGRPPFRGATVAETIQQVLHREPVPVRQLDPAVPRDLETICHKCLQKDAAKRYASAAALADDLGRFLEGRPILARPVGVVERAYRWVKRNRVVTALTAAVFLVLTAGVIASSCLAAWALAKAEDERIQREEATRLTGVANDERIETLRQKNLADAERAEAFRQKGIAERNERLAKNATHAIRAGLALQARDASNWDGVRQFLEETHAERGATLENRLLHGWWLRRAFAVRDLVGHPYAATSVAWSRDGARLASATAGDVRLWDAATGREQFVREVSPGQVRGVALSPDGRRVVHAGGQFGKPGEVVVWDADTGRDVAACQGHADLVGGVAFHPDGKRLLTGGADGTVRLWDAETGKELRVFKGHARAVHCVAVSADGARVAAGGDDGTTRVWQVETGDEVGVCKGEPRPVLSVAFRPDGQRLVTGGGHDGARPTALDTEVRVWDAATGKEVLVLRGHTDAVRGVCFSPDGKYVLTGSRDQSARVWNAANGTELFAVKETFGSGVLAVAFSPDGARLVTANAGGTVRIWLAELGHEALALAGHAGRLNDVAYSPDGTRLVVAGGDPDGPPDARIWDADTGVVLSHLRGHKGSVRSAAFSPDGKRVVTAGGERNQPGEVKVWDAATGAELLALRGLNAHVVNADLSPDGTRILVGFLNRAPGLWDAATGAELPGPLADAPPSGPVAFSPDGRWLATAGSGGDIRIARAATGEEVRTVHVATDFVTRLAFSTDGGRLLVVANIRPPGVWDVASGALLGSLGAARSRVHDARFSPDGTRVVTAETLPFPAGGMVRVWDADTFQEKLAFRTSAEAVAFRPDGRRLATAGFDRTVRVWDAGTTAELVAVTGVPTPVRAAVFHADGGQLLTASGGADPGSRPVPGEVALWDARQGKRVRAVLGPLPGFACAAFSPDGRRVAVGSATAAEPPQPGRGEVKVFDTATGGEVRSFGGLAPGLRGLAFSPDGRRLLAGGQDRLARLWDLETGEEQFQLKGHTNAIAGVAFSADGTRIATASWDQSVRIWDAGTGAVLHVLKGHRLGVWCVAFSPDGRLVASSAGEGFAQRELTLWDAATGKEVRRLRGHTGAVTSLAFRPDGARLVTGGWDGTARVWDVATGVEVQSFRGHYRKVTCVAFSADGRQILTGGDDRTVRIWAAAPD